MRKKKIFQALCIIFLIAFVGLYVENFVFKFFPEDLPVNPGIDTNPEPGSRPTFEDLMALFRKTVEMFGYGIFTIGFSLAGSVFSGYLNGWRSYISSIFSKFFQNWVGNTLDSLSEEVLGTPGDILEAVNQTKGGNFLNLSNYSSLFLGIFSSLGFCLKFLQSILQKEVPLAAMEEINGIPEDMHEILDSYEGSKILQGIASFFPVKPLLNPTVQQPIHQEEKVLKAAEVLLTQENLSKLLGLGLFVGSIVIHIYLGPLLSQYLFKLSSTTVVGEEAAEEAQDEEEPKQVMEYDD